VAEPPSGPGWAGEDDPKGGAILKITFAGLLSCSGENKLPKCALPHRPNSPGRATLLQRTVDLTLTPRLFRTNSVRGPKCPVPPWSRTVGEPRAAARLFHFSEWICISQNFNDRRARAAREPKTGGAYPPEAFSVSGLTLSFVILLLCAADDVAIGIRFVG
jgi:hypothetical protein